MEDISLIKNNKLISEKEWDHILDRLHKPYDEKSLITDKEPAKQQIKSALIDSIKPLAKGDFGILLSGGLDSSLIALICKKHLKKRFACYSIGLEGSSDIEYSIKVSKLLNLDLKTKILTLTEIESYLKKCISILNTRDVVKLEIAIVIYAALDFANQQGCKNLFTGSGSEEIFAGYEKHLGFLKEGHKNIYEECWKGLRYSYSKDILRDYSLAKELNSNLLMPFLDPKMISIAMNIHPSLKLDNNEKKAILRELAFELGLSREIAYRKRTAAQYGSKVSSSVLKLTKKNGFKLKQDYINSIKL